MNISITSDFHEGICSISMRGKLDSANAGEAHEMILHEIGSYPHLSHLRLDMGELSYISSAGLRILLMLKNAIPKIDIINASPAVFSTMQMTGFTKIFEVQKAFRSVDVTGCDLIVPGLTSRIYRLDDATVIKVYPDIEGYSHLYSEHETAQKAFILGIPAAISYEIVRVGQQYGIAYRMTDAKSLSLLISEWPSELSVYAEKLSSLARSIHFTHASDSQFQTARGIALAVLATFRNRLTIEQYEHISALIKAIPLTDTLIHGAMRPDSILCHDCRYEFIDTGLICIGHPSLDMLALYESSNDNENEFGIPEYFGLSPEICTDLWHTFCRAYFAENHTQENMRILNGYLGKLSLLKTVIDKYRRYGDPLNCSDEQISELRPLTEALMRVHPNCLHAEAETVTAFLPKP